MRNFYIRLAVSNIKKNKPVYYPFFLTNILSVMIFYVMASIQNQTIIATLPGSYIFVQFLKVGVVMTGIFAGFNYFSYTQTDCSYGSEKKNWGYMQFSVWKKSISQRYLCLKACCLQLPDLWRVLFWVSLWENSFSLFCLNCYT